MSLSDDEGLIQKYEELQRHLSMSVQIRQDQIMEIVVADLIAKYKASAARKDRYELAFETVLSFYLDDDEMNEMRELIK